MKKNIYAALMLSAAVLLSGCSGSYSFDDSELSHAIGVERSVFDSLDIQPDDDGETGNALMEQAKAMGGADSYTYFFPCSGSDDSFEIVEIFFYGGKASSVEVAVYGDEKSKYSVLGICVGEDKDSALSKGESYFGTSGEVFSEAYPDLYDLGDRTTDTVTFGGASDKKGTLTVKYDLKSDKVINVEYSK